jgi:hypothetical protein
MVTLPVAVLLRFFAMLNNVLISHNALHSNTVSLYLNILHRVA